MLERERVQERQWRRQETEQTYLMKVVVVEIITLHHVEHGSLLLLMIHRTRHRVDVTFTTSRSRRLIGRSVPQLVMVALHVASFIGVVVAVVVAATVRPRLLVLIVIEGAFVVVLVVTFLVLQTDWFHTGNWRRKCFFFHHDCL